MVSKTKRLELNCLICSKPLTSTLDCLNEEALSLIAEQTVVKRNDYPESNRFTEIDQDQTVATKCGHMFHMGCLRSHIRASVESKGQPMCPMCKKPIALTKVWPVLIPPTPAQVARMTRIHQMKIQNNELKIELAEIRDKIRDGELQLAKIEKQTSKCLEAINRKQKILESLKGPSDEEIEHLRKVHQKRQSIVRTVTKHNAELLGVLMHETNVHSSEPDISVSSFKFMTNPDLNNNFTRSSSTSFNNIKTRRSMKGGSKLVSFSDSFEEIDTEVSSATFSAKTSRSVIKRDSLNNNCWKAYPKEKFPNCPAHMRRELNFIANTNLQDHNPKKGEINGNPLRAEGPRLIIDDDGRRKAKKIVDEDLDWENARGFVFGRPPLPPSRHKKNLKYSKPKTKSKKVPVKPKWVN